MNITHINHNYIVINQTLLLKLKHKICLFIWWCIIPRLDAKISVVITFKLIIWIGYISKSGIHHYLSLILIKLYFNIFFNRLSCHIPWQQYLFIIYLNLSTYLFYVWNGIQNFTFWYIFVILVYNNAFLAIFWE